MSIYRTAIAAMAAGVLLLVLSAGSLSPADGQRSAAADVPAFPSLKGRLLVAAPGMPDPRFAETVIIMVQHDADGALGLIVNRPIGAEPAGRLLRRLAGLDPGNEGGPVVRIHFGGPVEPLQGFFLHTPDYRLNDTVAVTDQVSVTSDLGILRDLAVGKGPERGFLALGYAGWSPGQLENELRRKDWVTVESDKALVFDNDMASRWQRAMDKRGVDL